MTHDDIFNRLKAMMQDTTQVEIDWDAVNDDTSIESLGFDSLSILDLVYDVQQEFKLEFEAEEIVAVRTTGQLIDFLQAKLSS